MLPSHNLLKSFPCPYYISGFCERPHCLFRHERRDAVHALKTAPYIQTFSAEEDNQEEVVPLKENKYEKISNRNHYSSGYRKEDLSISSSTPKYSSTKAIAEEKPAVTKTYVTPLNQSLPLPVLVFKRDDLQSTTESIKRINPDPAENCSKRRKISDNSIQNSTTTKDSDILSPDLLPVTKASDAPPNNKANQVKPESSNSNSVHPKDTEAPSSSPSKDDKKSPNASEVQKEKKSSPRKETSKSPSKTDGEKKSRHKDSKSHKDSQKSSHSSSRSHSSHSHKSKHSDSSSKRSSDSKHHKSSSKSEKSSESKRSDKHSDKNKSKSSSSHRSSSSRSSDKGSRSSHRDKDKKEEPKEALPQSELSSDFLEMKDISEEFRYPEYNDDDDDDPDEVAMECLKMFEDYSAEEISKTTPAFQNTMMSALNASFDTKDTTEGDTAFGKKRLAHTGAEQRSASMSARNNVKAAPKVTHSELNKIMLQRMQAVAEAQKRADEAADLKKNEEEVAAVQKHNFKERAISPLKSSTHSLAANSKKRIAHVSNVNMLIKPQNSQSANVSHSKKTSTAITIKEGTKTTQEISTIAQTNTKGQSRVAHAPNKVFAQSSKPLITLEAASINTKVPLAFRQKILFQMYQECLKWFPDSAAAERARKEEADVAGRCSSKMVYFSAATNAITRLRKESSSDSSSNASLANSQKLAGSAGPKNSWSIESNAKKSFRLPVGTSLFQCLKKFLLTEEELDLHGYPLPHPSGEPGRAVSKIRRRSEHKPIIVNGVQSTTSRVCERCTKPYRTDLDGMPLIKEKCVYHFGRRFNRKTKGLLESRYNCCDGEPTSEGCSVAPTHVSALPGSEDDLTGFVAAVKENGDDDVMGTSLWDIIALDCEMVYTTVGSELARVTIVDCQKKILYDQLVTPPHPVLDYNTRFSGITEEIMLQGPTVSLIQVQAVLLTQLKPNSILIGHSLESDLHALKIMHRTVIDTSVLFPHRLGLPYKRALRTLSAEYCGQIIQSSVNGHNSSEDALAALDLVFYKLKELA